MKYVGSKNRIAKYIIPIILKCIADNNLSVYYEPFVGGANIIDKIPPPIKRIGNDSNEYLIEFYNKIRRGWRFESVEMTKELYSDIRNNKSSYPKEIVALAGICGSYNAKWFGGYAGEIQTKEGTMRNYYNESVRNVLKQLPKLNDILFLCGNYDSIQIENAFIYCDPPYSETLNYKDDFSSEKYWEWVRETSKDNYVICSEYKAPEDFIEIWNYPLVTTVDNASRKQSVEKLFTYNKGLYLKGCES